MQIAPAQRIGAGIVGLEPDPTQGRGAADGLRHRGPAEDATRQSARGRSANRRQALALAPSPRSPIAPLAVGTLHTGFRFDLERLETIAPIDVAPLDSPDTARRHANDDTHARTRRSPLVAIAAGAALRRRRRGRRRSQAPRARRGAAPRREPRAAMPTAAPPRGAGRAGAAAARGAAVNIRVDLTLTDQRGGADADQADGHRARRRRLHRLDPDESQVVRSASPVPLNVDASPTLLADGKIRLAINLQYDWPAPTDGNRDARHRRLSDARCTIS